MNKLLIMLLGFFTFLTILAVSSAALHDNVVVTNEQFKTYVVDNCNPQFEQPKDDSGKYGTTVYASVDPIDWICPNGVTVRM